MGNMNSSRFTDAGTAGAVFDLPLGAWPGEEEASSWEMTWSEGMVLLVVIFGNLG